jgi:YggT family protein
VATLISLYLLLLTAVRWAFLVIALVLAAACLLDWLVRTRRINPFSAPARFARKTIDPAMAPMERRILRAGGTPTNAPWWTLVVVVVAGVVVISLLQFVGAQLAALSYAAARGPGGLLVLVLTALFALLQIALLVRVFSSWFPVSPHSPWLRWSYVLTEPILAPLRAVVPTLGPVDITPIVAYFLLRIVSGLVIGGVASLVGAGAPG